MPYRPLFFLVEGDDDERFIQEILDRGFLSQYDHVKIVKYAQESTKKMRNLIRSIQSMGADHLFFHDFDQGPCITSKKEYVQNKYSEHVAAETIQIVIREIESWYAAGINSEAAAKRGVDELATTDELTKEQFNRIIPKRFGSRIVFMREVLKGFDLETAKRKNKSIAYFCRTYLAS